MKSLSPLLLLSTFALAGPAPELSGSWSIDLRNTSEIKAGLACGNAGLHLQQSGQTITGTYHYATPGCGRIEESGTVVGSATANAAILNITSTRNGAIVRGQAQLHGNKLLWQALEVVKEGVPAGDELILQHAELRREKNP